MMAVPRLQSQTAGWTSSPHLTFSPQHSATSSASLLNCLASLHKSSPSPTTCTGSSCASAACFSCRKWKKTPISHLIFHLSQPRVSSRQKSSHNSLLPLQRVCDPPIRFLLPEILVLKIRFRDSQIFFSRLRLLDINFRKESCFEILFLATFIRFPFSTFNDQKQNTALPW